MTLLLMKATFDIVFLLELQEVRVGNSAYRLQTKDFRDKGADLSKESLLGGSWRGSFRNSNLTMRRGDRACVTTKYAKTLPSSPTFTDFFTFSVFKGDVFLATFLEAAFLTGVARCFGDFRGVDFLVVDEGDGVGVAYVDGEESALGVGQSRIYYILAYVNGWFSRASFACLFGY